jgi:hypothetical protein
MAAGLFFIFLVCALRGGNSIQVCFTGYVMDTYCINRGTLLDNPSLQTLIHPDKHSVHCLVDVPACYQSGFELLADPAQGSQIYPRAYALDQNGNNMVLQIARSTGSCSTCSNNPGGLVRGFRATITGVSTGQGSPALLQVSKVEVGTTCVNGSTIPANLVTDTVNQFIVYHGTLMVLSWGLLLPCGVISAHFLKHRGPMWFRLHRGIQVTGLLLAIGGFVIALTQLPIPPGVLTATTHKVTGMVIMGLGILQPINAFFRPHPCKEGDSDDLKGIRQRWEFVHKSTGFAALGLALIIQIPLGIYLSQNMMILFGYCVAVGVVISYTFWAKGDLLRFGSLKTQEEM